MIVDPDNAPRGPSPTAAELHFLGWDAPALPQAAKLLADTYKGPEELDLRNVVVVTPGARAGRRLGELLLDEAEARGLPLTPPTSVTMGHFPELLYQPAKPSADTTERRHAFMQALRSLDPARLEELFPLRPPGLAGWMGLAGIVERLHREIAAEGLDFREVSREFRRGFPYDDSRRWEVLAEVEKAYDEVLAEAGLTDRDRERIRALEEGRLEAPGEVWLVGVVELPRVVRRMIEALSVPVRALIHAPERLRERFDALGCLLPAAWQREPLPVRDEQVKVVQQPRDQGTAVVEALRSLGGRYGADEVVVGVPDTEIVPYVERSLTSAGAPHRFAAGTPLEQTGPARLLQALAEYLDGKSFSAFAALVRHPELHTLTGGSESLTVLDRYHADHLQSSVEGPLPGRGRWAQGVRELVIRVEEALGLDALGGSRPLSQWMPAFLEILVGVYGAEPLDRSRPSDRRRLEALTRIKDAATRLATLPRPLDERVEAAEALAVLLAELTGPDLAIPPDPEEHAVELLGWLELPLDDAPVVVVTGVNERVLPEAVGADPFLPGGLRTRLGLPDDEARYARDAYLLSALLHSREEVRLIAGRTSAAGDPLRPSRLLLAADPKTMARRVLRILKGEGEGTAAAPGAAEVPSAPAVPGAAEVAGARGRGAQPPGAAQAPGARPPLAPPVATSRFRSPPEDPLPPLASLTEISVTAFRTYLQDPYRYALERVLGLEELDDTAREMEPMLFGTVAHGVLETFGRSEAAASEDAREVADALVHLLDDAVRSRFGKRPLPAVRVQVEQLRARLQSFASWQAGWVRQGWRVEAVEVSLDGVRFDVDGEPVLLKGKIDRIDHNAATGEWALFDYKTGDAAKKPEDLHQKGRQGAKEWIDLQLPLYRYLLRGVVDEQGSPLVPEASWRDVKLGYILLPKDLGKTGEAIAAWTEEDLEDAYETARRVVRELRTNPFRYDRDRPSPRDDPFAALLGRLELPSAGEENGEEGEP